MWPRVGKARGGPCCGGFFVLLCVVSFKRFLFWLGYLHSAAASFTSVLPLRARKSGQAQQLRRLAGEHCGWVVLLRPRGSACGLGLAKPAPAEALAVWLLRPPLLRCGVSFKCFLFWLGYLRLTTSWCALMSFSSGAHRARRFQVAGAATDSGRIYQLGHRARRFQLAGAAADSGRIYQLSTVSSGWSCG
jgi:hypothetical protein